MTSSQSPMTVDFNSNNHPDKTGSLALISVWDVRSPHKGFPYPGPGGEEGGCVIIGPVLDNARSGQAGSPWHPDTDPGPGEPVTQHWQLKFDKQNIYTIGKYSNHKREKYPIRKNMWMRREEIYYNHWVMIKMFRNVASELWSMYKAPMLGSLEIC